ncbi:MAG: SET domain-containing protein-lysine N-methyltransferase [Candidatus Micrarchaeota archaeon]|nr:SET domain-containing protein-lysine N-methyltransferase [Candidatus Micrarchaeota archaeon]
MSRVQISPGPFMMVKSYYVAKSRFGKGVFASRGIRKGELIMRFRGRIISGSGLDNVSEKGRDPLTDPLQVDGNKFMLIMEPYVLVNHSCDPNSGIKGGTDLIAITKIRKDEEILYDYSSVWLEGFGCKCGSPNCRGFVSEFTSIPKRKQKRYIKLGIVPDFIIDRINLD